MNGLIVSFSIFPELFSKESSLPVIRIVLHREPLVSASNGAVVEKTSVEQMVAAPRSPVENQVRSGESRENEKTTAASGRTHIVAARKSFTDAESGVARRVCTSKHLFFAAGQTKLSQTYLLHREDQQRNYTTKTFTRHSLCILHCQLLQFLYIHTIPVNLCCGYFSPASRS